MNDVDLVKALAAADYPVTAEQTHDWTGIDLAPVVSIIFWAWLRNKDERLSRTKAWNEIEDVIQKLRRAQKVLGGK